MEDGVAAVWDMPGYRDTRDNAIVVYTKCGIDFDPASTSDLKIDEMSTLFKSFLDMYEWGCYKGTFEEINETLGDLKCTEKITLETMVDILYRIAPADYDNDPELCSARRRLSIMETLNGGEIRYIADWFNADLRRVVEDAKEKLFEPRNAVKAYRRTSKIHDTLVISAFQLRLSDELENIKKFVKKCVEVVNLVEAIPSIILVGFASLTLTWMFKCG
ncbi:hypothetical protein GQ600_21688 [Phytophthora cactorum]|nr:hypothetical protein GQ600_21688 [Phytophthora cactorum]